MIRYKNHSIEKEERRERTDEEYLADLEAKSKDCEKKSPEIRKYADGKRDLPDFPLSNQSTQSVNNESAPSPAPKKKTKKSSSKGI